MPYKISKNRDGSYRVTNRDTGRVLAKQTTRMKAEAQVRLLKSKET